MDLQHYFRRIGYDGPRAPTPDVLAAVAHRHAMAIPFENIAVLASGPPDLEPGAVEAKLVGARRGGYCYEQNALLMAALTALGFRVTGLSARVRYGIPPEVMSARSHMVLQVATDAGSMIVDAGFGGLTLTAPVPLRWHEEHQTPHERVRLVPVDDDHLLQARIGDAWFDVYRFDLSRHLHADYVQQNWHTATRPNALFGNNLVVTLPRADGRYALFNRTLTWRPLAGEKTRSEIDSRDRLRTVLADVFGLEVTPEELDKAWDVAGRGAASSPAFS
jgi:N-hydroxyarylamine O-acetyltransferase